MPFLLPSTSRKRRLAVLALALSCASAAPAQPFVVTDEGADDGSAALIAETRQWLDDAVARASAAAATPLRLEVSLGALDSRLRLAPCARVEPYLPAGTRLWGRTRIGLRCADGVARWNVFLPVTVKAFGPAWVLQGNVSAGAELSAADAVQSEADWAAENSSVVADPAQWIGQTATRALAAGQPLRQSMLRPPQVFAAGAQVRVIAVGSGFQVTTDAQALTPGVIGQAVRLRLDSGRITSGVVQDARTVRLAL